MALTKIGKEGITGISNSSDATAITIDSSENVGIGTSSPSFENGGGLEVNYSAGLGSHLKLTDSASGSGGTNGFDLYAFNTSGYIENYEAGSIVFRNNGSERMRILSSGGITFNGDTATVNALDDYEEGTFTPAINSGATGGSYSGTGGNYTKIGNFVTFTIRFQPVGWTANGGGFNLSGLPFTSATGVQQGGAFFNYIGNFETPTPTMHISAGANLIVFFNTAGTGLVGNTIDNLNVTIHIQGFYYAA